MSESAVAVKGETGIATTAKFLPNLYFLGKKSGDATKTPAKAAGVDENEFYLKDQHGIVALKPCRIVPTDFGYKCWIKRDKKDYSNILEVKEEDPGKGAGFSEHRVELVYLLSKDNTPEPAFLKTDSALNRLWDGIADFVKLAEAGGDKWARRGPVAATTAGIQAPASFKVIAQISGREQEPKDPNGNPYNLGLSTCSPAPVDVVGRCVALSKSEDGLAAIEQFEKVVAKLQEKVV